MPWTGTKQKRMMNFIINTHMSMHTLNFQNWFGTARFDIDIPIFRNITDLSIVHLDQSINLTNFPNLRRLTLCAVNENMYSPLPHLKYLEYLDWLPLLHVWPSVNTIFICTVIPDGYHNIKHVRTNKITNIPKYMRAQIETLELNIYMSARFSEFRHRTSNIDIDTSEFTTLKHLSFPRDPNSNQHD